MSPPTISIILSVWDITWESVLRHCIVWALPCIRYNACNSLKGCYRFDCFTVTYMYEKEIYGTKFLQSIFNRRLLETD